MKSPAPFHCHITLFSLLGLLSAAGRAPAAVTVLGTSSFDAGTGRYLYQYSVSNSASAEEIIQVTFPVSPAAALLGLTAPTGFKLTYDTVADRVNFIWDDDDFTPQTFAPNSTVSGFRFTSPDAPGMVQFTASDINGDTSGFTSAPVPEPSALMLGAAALPVLLRRRRS
jgi:hypothetical protein